MLKQDDSEICLLTAGSVRYAGTVKLKTKNIFFVNVIYIAIPVTNSSGSEVYWIYDYG